MRARLSVRRWLLVGGVLCGLLGGCSGGDPVAAYRKGDYATSYAHYHARAAAGDLEALNIVGVHHYLGLGVPRDYAQAAAAFEQAALADLPPAQYNLALLYMHGRGVNQDLHRAYGWFFRAYDGGRPRARAYVKFLGDNVTPNAGQKARAVVDELVRSHRREQRRADTG